MAPTKKANQAQLAKARNCLAQKKDIIDSETAKEDLWTKLNAANLRIKKLELALAQKNAVCEELRSDLEISKDQHEKLVSKFEKLSKKQTHARADVSLWKSKYQTTYHELCMQHQATQRGRDKLEKIEKQMELLKKAEAEAEARFLNGVKHSEKALALLTKTNEGLWSELSRSLARWTLQLDKKRDKLDASHSNLKALQKEASILRKVVTRAKECKERAIASLRSKISQECSIHHLKCKGVYTEDTRNVVRLLVKAGCSRNYINEVISTVLASAGIKSIGAVSRPSVGRILREGYYAAQIQLGFEMKNAESMTFSADGTSHRNINYDSRHVHLCAEDYESPDIQGAKQQVTCFLGIQSTCDGSSEGAIVDWEDTLKKSIDVYNGSPLGKRSGAMIRLIDLLIKLMGMNTDHCTKEKKTARLLAALKESAVDQHLGEDALLDLSYHESAELFQKAENKMIKAAGGQNKWNALSHIEKSERNAVMLEEVIAELGRKVFDTLSDEEKQALRLFIWTGCGCHKDLNTVKGGYMAMAGFWLEKGLEGPVLLANKDNDPVVQERHAVLEKGDTPTPAQDRAFSKSTRGAIKTAEIAGALLNHKDDKKGHHDYFRYWWWEHVGTAFTFPDTSNNRFQSFCDAAAALVLHKETFIDFLENVRITKQNSKLNHMEQNLWNALHCQATMAELAVLAIYAEAVSYPYMKAIHASTDNMLDLGPFHNRVYEHMQKIIDNPDILIGEDVTYSSASLDGDEWQNAAVVEKILDLAPALPHFKDLLLAFFEGAAITWKRFTSEFAPGGLIDEATVVEKELAWMPSHNDANEGSLGMFRQLMNKQPQLTLLSHNALTMFFRNNTQKFMVAKFTTEEDYRYIHKLGQENQTEEAERRQKFVANKVNTQVVKTARKEKRVCKAQEKKDRIAGLNMILDKEKAIALKSQALRDHWQLFKDEQAPNLIGCSIPKLVADMRKGLSDAIDLYLTGEWVIEQDEEESEEEGEEEEEENNDDDDMWEDDD